MKVYWIFLVIISLQYLSFLDGLKLENNGYKDLYIIIKENVQESEELLDRIKVIFSEASTMLYIATHKRAYFKTIKVVIPRTWSRKNSYKTVSGLSSITSHIRIGDDANIPPYTSSGGVCGKEGEYMFLPLEEFIMLEGKTSWGNHDHVIVHEWGHLRWGLRDEYPTIPRSGSNGSGNNAVNPGGGDNLSVGSGGSTLNFYQADGVWKPVSCSRELNGYASTDCTSGQIEGNCDLSDVSVIINPDCQYCPYQTQPYNASIMDRQYLPTVVEFCDKDDPNTPEYIRHNSQVENEQNIFCNGKSAWEVMIEHEDFRDGNNLPMASSYPPQVDFQFVQQSINKARIFVLDSSGSMRSAQRITKLHNMMKIIIEDVLPDGSWISIIDFDSDAVLLTEFVQLNSTSFRQHLAQLIPNSADGGTCIPCGLDLAVDTLSKFEILDSTEEAEVVLISDGQNGRGDLYAATQNCIDAGVVVTSVALSNSADQRLVSISERTGGRLLHITDDGTVSLAVAFTDVVSGGVATDSESATTMMNEQVSITVNDKVTIEFNIDDGLGKDTTVTVLTTVDSTMSIQLNGPNNFKRTKSETNVQTLSLVVPGVSQLGKYTAQITSSTSAKVEIIVTSKPMSTSAQVIRSTVRLSTNAYDFNGTALPIMFVHLRKGESPVKKAVVKVHIEDAQGSKTCELQLFDNGVGDDILSGDGIYTASILRECIRKNGRHSSKVLITGTAETVATLYFSSKSAMIGSVIPPTTNTPTGSFERVAVGDAYTVSNYTPELASADITPPGRITDIQVIDIHSGLPSTGSTRNYTITWTAPGDDANVGNASFYEMRISNDSRVLRQNFLTAEELNTGGSAMSPKASGKVERLVMTVSTDDSFTSTTNFAIVAIDEVGNRGPVSNIIPITIGSTSQFEVTEEECTNDCYVIVKDCGRSLTVLNGQVNLTNVLTTAGTNIPVKCNVGYELSGGTTILCLENGTWSNSVTCDIVGCGGISIPNGGLEFPNGTNYGDTALIECSDGYHLTGANSVTCMSNGNWGTPGACDKNDCGKNETIAHGQIDFTNVDTTFGQSVQVTCDTGYKLFGGSFIVCLADGQWSKTVQCDVIDCEGTTILNGKVLFPSGTKYNAVADVECHDGYRVNGSDTITCLSSGMWSTDSECIPKDCGTSVTITNGYVNFTNVQTTFGHTVPIMCNKGHELLGGNIIKCESSGNWTTTASCVITDCQPTSITDGQVSHPSGTKYSARAIVKCDTGYEVVGTGFLVCLESGLWNTESQCIIRDCGRSETVDNGQVNFTDALTTYGHSVPVSCNIGYRRMGGTSIDCLADGTWSKPVRCELVGCGGASIANGEIQFPAGTDYNAVAFVNCNNGFHLTTESNRIVCLHSGVWNISVKCEINDCGTNVSIPNGHVDFTGLPTTYGQYIPVTCDQGYRTRGGTHIQCLYDGVWSDTVTCKIVDCGPTALSNGALDFSDGFKYNAKAKLGCDVGFRVHGTGFITCLETGIWSNDSNCFIIDCGSSAAVDNGHVNFTDVVTTYGQPAPVSCHIGYRRIGGKSIECLADGTWSKSVTCELVGCGGASIANGEIRFPSGTDYNAVAFVDCSTGFHLTTESNQIVCLHNGRWNITVQCEINDCGTHITIPNGFADFIGILTTYGQYVPVICDKGYRRQGGTHIQCLSTGVWSRTVNCEIVDCGTDFEFENGQANLTGRQTTFGESIPIVCDKGFRLNGNEMITCLSNRTWSTFPACEKIDEGMSSGLKVISIAAGSFGLLALVILGLLTRSLIMKARTRAPRKGHNTAYVHHKHNYMPKDTILEPVPDYNMDYEDWYLYHNRQIRSFDQHHRDDIFY